MGLGLGVGADLSLRLTGSSYVVGSGVAPPTGSVPSNLTAPVVSGYPYVGQTLTVTPGTWTGTPTSYSYQWYYDNSEIAGATSTTLAVASGQLGASITVRETAYNSAGASVARSSNGTAPIGPTQTLSTITLSSSTVTENSAAGTFVGTIQNRISGSTLSLISDAGGRFAISGGTIVTGSTATDYEASTSHSITIRETLAYATNSPLDSTITISVVNVVDSAPVNVTAPIITGSAVSGSTLTAGVGTWTESPSSYTYQWYADGASIGGATSSTYTPGSGQIGKVITVKVAASNDFGTSSQATSAATSAVTSAAAIAQLISDGGWTWYNDPRAIVTGERILVGSITGTAANGDIRITQFSGGSASTFELHSNLELDDHDNPALLELPGGKFAAFYCKHTDTSGLRYRVTSSPRSIAAWETEVLIPNYGVEVSYAKPFILSDGIIRIFQRSSVNPTRPYHMIKATAASISGGGTSWTRTSVIQATGQRPYGILRQNGDRIDFLMTNGHPNETVTSLYHIYMQLVGGVEKWYKSDGTEITSGYPIDPSTQGTLIQNATGGRCWNWDIRLGGDGKPRVLATRYPSSTGARDVPFSDIEYWHYRWTGSAWTGFRIASSQISLYANENHYAGGMCFDANDITTVYLSLVVSGKYEISEWLINEGAQTISKVRDITTGSSYHNIRPYSPDNYTSALGVIWCYGAYTTYTNYELAPWYFPCSHSVAVAAPTHFSVPTLSDTTPAQNGEVLCTHYAMGWETVSYQWKLNGSNVSGATSSSYTPTASDVGKTLSVTVTATNSAGSTSSTSASSSAITETPPVILLDTFTEASNVTLASHTPEMGSAWVAAASTMTVGGGTGYVAGTSSTSSALYYNNASPTSPDYTIEAVVQRPSTDTATFRAQGVLARFVNTSNYYQAYYDDNVGALKLQKVVGGTATTLGSSTATFNANTDYTLSFALSGTSLKVYWDGVEKISVTDGSLTAAGKIGIRGRANGKIMSVTAY